MTTRKPILIGPFSKGLNTYDDPTAIDDRELVEALNFDPGFDGSLRSRPPFTDTGDPLPLGATGSPRLLGYYYDNNNVPYLIASDGLSSTWQYNGSAWALITNTFAASDMVQFDGKAWLVSPVNETDPGGSWNPTLGFVADADMPHGSSIASYKSRLWIAQGFGGSNPTRLYYSKALGQPSFWASPGFIDVGSGDGESVIKVVQYFDTLLIFRTKSIWSFQYGIDPATAVQGVLVPGVGLQTTRAIVAYENYLYFMYDEKAYQFINNRVQQINIKVPFRASNPGSTNDPFHVSLFNNRILYSYYEMIYVYSLRTQTWTTWRSDTWGPIGQVMSSFVSGDTDEAYGLPSATSASAVTARNRALNPSLKHNLTAWGASTGSPILTRNAGSSIPGHTHYLQAESNGGGNQVIRAENAPATPGEKLSAMFDIRVTTGAAINYQLSMHCIKGGTEGSGNGTIIGSAQSGPVVPIAPGDGWVTVKISGLDVRPETEWVRFYVDFKGTTDGQIMNVDNFRFDAAPNGTDPLSMYLDGDTVSSDPDIVYEWTGDDGNSASVQRTNRMLNLLRIEDRFNTNRETMECSIRTKNYNFEVPGSYKVLFWWGLDAIFRTNVTAQVSPVVFNAVTMWGQLLAAGATWGGLLAAGRTWQFPEAEGNNGVTSEVVAASGPARKFVKFFKKLRFRQVFFRIKFTTDGSNATAPVQIFTLSTYMAEKETVSKTLS